MGNARVTTHFATVTTGYYPVVVAVFCGLLLISNIGATKLIEFGPIITDGGAFLFPLVYITGDVLIYKTLLEVVLLPITYRVIAAVKKREPTY